MAWPSLRKRSSLHLDLFIPLIPYIQKFFIWTLFKFLTNSFVMAQNTIIRLNQPLLLLSIIALASTQPPQCPNNLAVYNPNLRTTCVNGSLLPPNFPFLSYIPQTILIPSHSILYCTRGHRYSPERRRALQARTRSHVRQDPLSERIPSREASRACRN